MRACMTCGPVLVVEFKVVRAKDTVGLNIPLRTQARCMVNQSYWVFVGNIIEGYLCTRQGLRVTATHR